MLTKFNNHFVFISDKSFKQNKIVEKELRFDVKLELLNNNYNNIVSIGGEAYLFGLTNDDIGRVINYTNSKYIYNDAYQNNKYFDKYLQNNLIDYNTTSDIKSGNILIINLSKLNINLLNIINNNIYNKIIIINCHHNEFWDRIKLLNNYKLTKRKQYIANNYFITVNILTYKFEIPIFIPLGNNCSIAYQLTKMNLRYDSYPFDWAKCNINKINEVLENNFIDYSKLTIKKFSDIHLDLYNHATGSFILTNKYNIHFAHELLNAANIHDLENIFNLRIKNFKNIKDKFILFIILNLQNKNIEYIFRLVNNLKLYFTNFKILYISKYIIEINNNLYNKYIIFHKIDVEWDTWKFDNLDWQKIIKLYQ